MTIIFCLFNYFPFGGLQRDFMRIAKACQQRGYEVEVYTTKWEGAKDPTLAIHVVPISGITNHARARSFAQQMHNLLLNRENHIVVGFNKMPGLDIYYAADVCYQERIATTRGWWYRLLPRYKQWLALEESVFKAGQATDILLISAKQQAAFTACYGTESERFHLLPPGISRDRMATTEAKLIRSAIREQLDLAANQFMLLMVGSGYQTKGLDRAILGLAALPDELRTHTHLYVIGKGDAAPFLALAKQHAVSANVHILGARDDVPHYLQAADLLLQPSYHENTGTVILEALAAGLPVLTTAVCGYAHYVVEAKAGVVLPEAFQQASWNAALQQLLTSDNLPELSANGLAFANIADIYSMPERAVDIIEKKVKQRVLSG